MQISELKSFSRKNTIKKLTVISSYELKHRAPQKEDQDEGLLPPHFLIIFFNTLAPKNILAQFCEKYFSNPYSFSHY